MSDQPPTPRWKTIVLAFLVVYPKLLLLTHVVAPQLAWLTPWLRDAVMVALMCTALSYFLPALTKVLGRWLYPKE